MADFKRVTVDDTMDIRYGGRAYMFLSASEQYRVRAILQLCIATLDGSQMVIFDGADILDNAGRNGLLSLLVSSNIHAIVAMTFNKPESVPDLSGVGKAYWIEKGICSEFNAQLAVAS